MGYLLKEALKTLCGVNQWSYAVFWKIGCQNPKLLIWEECYYGPIPYSGVSPMPGIENSNFAFRDVNLGFQGGDRVQLLVNKMMLDNHVNVVGEGLVGRAAFTGNYNWILSQNYTKEFHAPEVSNEMREQISAGMQTVAIIPVLPHGVVQLGSLSAITENLQFVNDVKSLILQLVYIPGVLLADNFATKEPSSEIGALVLENSASTSSGKSKVTHLTSYVTDNYNPQNDSPASRVDQTSNFLVRQIQDSLQPAGPNFQNHQLSDRSNSHAQAQGISNMKPMIDQRNKSENGMKGAEINSSNLNLWRHREPSFYIPGSMVNQQASLGLSATVSSSKILEDKLLPDAYVGSSGLRDSNSFLAEWTTEGSIASSNTVSGSAPKHKHTNQHNVMTSLSELSNVSSLSSAHGLMKGHNLPVCFAENDFQSGSLNSTQLSSMSISQNLAPNHLSPSTSACKNGLQDKTCTQVDPDRGKEEMSNTMFHNISIPFPPIGNHMDLCDHSPSFVHESQKQNCGYQNMGNAQFEDLIVQSQSRDDLFDVFGMSFKNSILDENWNSLVHDRPVTITQTLDKNNHTLHKLQNACSEMQVIDEGNSDSGALCVTSTDHLLDAVVSSVQAPTKQTSDDNISCRTTLTKISSAYAPTASTSKQANTSNQMQDVCIDLAKSLPNEGTFISSSFNYEPCKEESEIFSQTKSFYGSQSCSWVDQGPEIKKTTSSTAFSKRSDENSKSSRKRLKPGENPRPRPKDRQMIQDRVKELREIVPNSAKCSIDALLERTIKHMLFLQSVTKHADKLKQTGESKIINKEGGLLLKDNFEGGATWAYEVGSQSMVCPIIVEDLNQPRQMLVEMLCEERGLFLEIADIVRGLGLAILKGVMETRNDKIWARFAVEANRDVTRMEIFLSLVRLLGHTVKNSAVSANCVSNCVSNDGAHQAFHPGVSIAATGRPCSFQ